MKKYIFILSAIIVLSSCTKVIDVDLNEANPVVVLEANYTANDSTVRLDARYTSNFFGASTPENINNAVVTITDQAGTSTSVPFTSDGHYELTNYPAQFNTTYTLSTIVDGTNYTATCEMNDTIQQLPLYYEFFEQGFFGGEGGYLLNLIYQDPPETGDYTMAVYWRNDTISEGLDSYMLNEDVLTNGNVVLRPFITEYFKINDSLRVELRTIDKKIFDYYTELASLTNPNSAAPANPEFIWSNKALGYFSAYGYSEQTTVIQ
ncbi:MAG: DUF4249 family protein [Crocinitomicaceae bacterium]|nr:DUF4249 family protein [Crocinitomicaceae bacterium]